MSSRYTNKPVDWRKLDKDGAYRALHKGSGGGGMMRLWSWLMMFGDVMEDGSVMMVRERVSEMSGVVMKQVDRWRLDLVRAGWLKRHVKNSRVWVHPVMRWWGDVQYVSVIDHVDDDAKSDVIGGTRPTIYNGLPVVLGTAGEMKPSNLLDDATKRAMEQLAWYREREVINCEIDKVNDEMERCNHALYMTGMYKRKYDGMDKDWWIGMHADLTVRLRELYSRLKEHNERRGECFVKGGDGVWK